MTTGKTEKPKRETIEKIRNDKNPLEVRPNKTWPNMYEIFRSGGGKTPPGLTGQYTSHAVATQAIARHIG